MIVLSSKSQREQEGNQARLLLTNLFLYFLSRYKYEDQNNSA